jgi:Peptidase family M48/PDZ domain
LRRSRRSFAIAFLLLCTACAGPVSELPPLPADEVAAEQRRQQIAQIHDYYAQRWRVDNVAFHIRTANREFCKAVAPDIGLYAATVRSLPRKYRSYSNETLNLSWTVATAISVADASPAAAAGIKPGDQILTLDNEAVPDTRTAGWIGDWLQAHGGQPLQIMVRRDGADTLRTVRPVMACAIPVDLVIDGTANAYTDNKKIVIQSGVLRLTRNDADLAVIIGHELAHVTMGHYGKKLQNALVGELGGAVIDGGLLLGGIYSGRTFSKHFARAGAMAFSVEFEREADYVGAYYAARAGYDISGSENIWRAMALENPNSIRLAHTHPTSPARFVQMHKTITEIADKKRRHLPLLPDVKVVEVDAPPAAAREVNY